MQKKEIEELEVNISEYKEVIASWQKEVVAARGKITQLQRKCNHDFETIGTYGCHLVKCKICGYTTGG